MQLGNSITCGASSWVFPASLLFFSLVFCPNSFNLHLCPALADISSFWLLLLPLLTSHHFISWYVKLVWRLWLIGFPSNYLPFSQALSRWDWCAFIADATCCSCWKDRSMVTLVNEVNEEVKGYSWEVETVTVIGCAITHQPPSRYASVMLW